MSNLDKIYELHLDLVEDIKNDTMEFSKSDINTSMFYVVFTRNRREVIDFDLENTSAIFYIVTPEGDVTYQRLEYDEDQEKFYCDLEDNRKNTVGSYLGQIVLYDSKTNERLVIPTHINYEVKSDVLESVVSIMESEEQSALLEGLIQSVTNMEFRLDGLFDDAKLNESKTTDEKTAIDFYSNGRVVKTLEFVGGGGGIGNIVVETYDDISAITKAKVGQIIYVSSDSNVNGESNLYVIEGIDNNGVPTVYNSLNNFTKSAIPVLSYNSALPEGSTLYKTSDEDIILTFDFSSDAFGNGNYKIFKDGVLIKTLKDTKGVVIVSLGKIDTDGTFVFSVTATDFLGIPAPETLEYRVIVGGLTLTSTFEETLKTTVYETGDTVVVPYNVKCSDTSSKVKVMIKMIDANGTVTSEIINTNSNTASGTWSTNKTNVRGIYNIEVVAYTGSSAEDKTLGTFISDTLTYSFSVISTGEIAIIDKMSSYNFDTSMFISIPFVVSTKVATYLTAHGILYKQTNGQWVQHRQTSPTGISCSVGVTGYWSIGKLDEGVYKYELTASTNDGGITSIHKATNTFEVKKSEIVMLQPVSANLIAWFDANDKRNSDADNNIWYNKSSLGDTYRINLTGLNYSSNGWKHIDESLAEDQDGEMMLKFTGDSYGELVKVGAGGTTSRYSPFNIFSNAGAEGITIETCFRTRCVGEMKSRVLTCMKEDEDTTTGVMISHDTATISSDSQATSLNFMEDEWVHVAFVVDKNIRTLKDVGQDNIENLNQTGSMRIYINGVLCACSSLSIDKFLDASGGSYPLLLNACLKEGNLSNFGECEIKFIRIYNNYLKSSEVLNNYIASFYDPNEQQYMQDRNDTAKQTLPTIVFKRNTASTNKATFAVLNSITDKKTSKSTCVDCVMEFNDGEGNITVYDNVDVYLQGTSSLQYPVKNYKIKAYQDVERKVKNKFVPSLKEDEWTSDYTYTLKCDYMEQSHMNNTPTAKFYDQVVDALGGMSPAKAEGYRDAIDGFPCIVYYNEDPDNSEDVLVGSFMFNIDKSGAELGFKASNTCVSYEGTANASDTAGCFYRLSESIENVYKYYVEDSYTEYLKANGLKESDLSIDKFKDMINKGQVDYLPYEDFVADYDEIDYIMDDYEARYSYDEDNDENTYRPMVNLVNWVSDSTKNGTFKKDFEKHFNLPYVMAYFLQMQVFTQVDNCGKNAMWDTWDGQIFYPRPYDMDTSMGLSNTGTETISVDAEILPELSPTEATGTYASYMNSDTITQNRYLSFNTKTSKMWNNFAKEFASEIASAYQALRSSGVYTVDNIVSHAMSMTIDQIGEVYYNKDASSKYLSQTTKDNSEYLKMLHGNRLQKYKKFLTDRLNFLDTVYDYMESEVQSDTLNSIITLRSDVLYGSSDISSLKCYLGISVYSPQYVTISVGSGQDAIVTGYVSPQSTYIDPDTGMEHEGTLFSFPIKGTDKEMTISGAGNIKQINKMEDLNIRDLTITKAQKILKLNLSSSARMSALSLGNNKYLRELDCSFSYLLGTGTNGQLLNLAQCKNLRTIDLRYTKLTSVNLPDYGNLQSITIDGSTIRSLDMQGMEFLTDVSIAGCENITTYTVNNCPRLQLIDVSGTSVNAVNATNCKGLTEINLSNCRSMTSFDVTNSDNIKTLNMQSNTSPIMNDLQLYTLYNLETLYVNNTTSLQRIRFPKYVSATNQTDLWNKLKVFNPSNSSLKYVQYGSGTAGDVCDMSQLNQLSSLTFNNCTSLENVTGLNYSTSSLDSFFYNCQRLKTVGGTLTNSGNCNSMFYQCYALTGLDSLILNFSNCQSASSALARCYSIKVATLKKLLDACGSKLLYADNIVNMWGTWNYSPVSSSGAVIGNSGDDRTIPSNLFENTPNITTLHNAFYQTRFTTIPSNLFDNLSKLQNVSNTFTQMQNLTTVGSGLLKNKPSITNVSCCFARSVNLTNYFNSDVNIFDGSPNITDTSQMFTYCSKLVAPNGLNGMLNPLTKLQYAHYMFAKCSSMNCGVPNGFLSKNTSLRKIDGLFLDCSKLSVLPNSLFRVNASDTNTFPNLTLARNVFSGCSSLTGIVDANFFGGATELTDIGYGVSDIEHDSGSYYTGNGFFANTNLTGYYEGILYPLTKLVNCSGLFRQTSAKSTLKYCYYYKNNTVHEYNSGVSPNLFSKNTYLQSAPYLFTNNTGLLGCVPADLYKACKNTLRDVGASFMGCTGLTGINLDNEDVEVSSAVGVSSDWFSGAVNLQYVGNFLSGCTNFAGSVPKDLFKNCRSLIECSAMFHNCTALTGGVPIELFNYCRNTLRNTSYMFYNCIGLTEPLPTGTYSTEQGITGYEVCSSTTEGAFRVVNVVTDFETEIAYSTVISLSPDLATVITNTGAYHVKPTIGEVTTVIQSGLLAECLELRQTNSMFERCRYLGVGSGIPNDIFYTSSLTKKYNYLTNTSYMFYLTGFDQAYIDPNTEIAYLCSSDILTKCPSLTNISYMFAELNNLPACQLYMNMFAKQVALQNASGLFYGTPRLTGSITQTFLFNSLGTLTDVQRMFTFTNMTSVSSTFLYSGAKNTKLKYVGAIFYDCRNLTGDSPAFWNPNYFSNIEISNAGYYGALYNCTKLGNYSTANSNSTNWTVNTGLTQY